MPSATASRLNITPLQTPASVEIIMIVHVGKALILKVIGSFPDTFRIDEVPEEVGNASTPTRMRAPQIPQHLLRPCEGAPGVHDPFDIAQRPEMAGEGRWFHEALKLAEQHEFSFVERRLQALEEQTLIQCRQNMGYEERIAGSWSLGRGLP
jgi:hypothetical protein